jgi:hypothetical protein
LGFGEFFLGLILIPFSLVLIWKNEKKIVMYHRVILQAQTACKEVDPKEVKDEHDLDLVHAQGIATNDTKIVD